jgi:tetratricopeptide (TPR) repeat protein
VADIDADEQLEYFIEHVRLLLQGTAMEGLDAWAQRFSALRQISEFELCQRLAHAIRTADLPEHGIGIVRYGEGWLYDRIGRWPDAIKAYQESRRAFQKAKIPLDAVLLTQIGSIQQDQGQWHTAEQTYREALAAARDEHTRALVLINLGNLAVSRDDADNAESCYRDARDILGESDKRNFAAASHGLAAVLLDRGRLQESQDLQAECLALFQALNDPQGVASAIGGIATAQLHAGQPLAARHNFDTALQIHLDIRDHVGMTKTMANLGVTHQEMGELDTALEYFDRALEGYREIGDRHGEALTLVNVVRLHLRSGNQASAAAARNKAEAFCRQHGFADELHRVPSSSN